MLSAFLHISILALMPAVAAAQRPAGQHPPVQAPSAAQRPARPPLPPSVPPPVVFPLPPLMQPPAGGLTQPSPFPPPRLPGAPPDIFRVRPELAYRPRPYGGAIGYGYTGGVYDYPQAQSAAPLGIVPPTGLLRLSVTPERAQVFVDGYYVGTVADLDNQRGLTLDAGPHRVEFRASEYETSTVDVQVRPSDTVTYRGELVRVQPTAAPPRPATVREPMYVIPSCYIGNRPPRADRLPPGCSVSRVEVLSPK